MPTNQPTIQPRGKCPACSRELAMLDDGTVARPHRNGNGDRCKGYGNSAGIGMCAECGHEGTLNASGMVRRHRQRRVNVFGPYISGDDCAGGGRPPEPSDGGL